MLRSGLSLLLLMSEGLRGPLFPTEKLILVRCRHVPLALPPQWVPPPVPPLCWTVLHALPALSLPRFLCQHPAHLSEVGGHALYHEQSPASFSTSPSRHGQSWVRTNVFSFSLSFPTLKIPFLVSFLLSLCTFFLNYNGTSCWFLVFPYVSMP